MRRASRYFLLLIVVCTPRSETEKRLPDGPQVSQHELKASLPAPHEIVAVDLRCSAAGAGLTLESFQRVLEHASLLQTDPFADGWSYAPSYRGSVRGADISYACELFLGGRGALTSPSGRRAFFQFDPTLLPACAF